MYFHQVFRGDGGEVHAHWIAYTEEMDKMVEEAMRLNVKWSLQELSRAISGDGKTMPDPVFKVKVVLEDTTLQFSPSIDQVAEYISTISRELINTLSVFQRLPEILARRRVRDTKEVSM